MCSESNIDHSQRNVSDQSTQTGQRPIQAEAQIHPASEQIPEEPRMIGDFDGSSNALWTLFRDEAKSHDNAQIVTLKDDMGNSLVFAGLFSAALTAFVVDTKRNLQSSPADETVYYLRQHSTILSQISVQLSSITPQISIPSTPPPPFPAFNPSAFDVRVNAFWFMALAFSLLAAFLAILVQQWARNYMHVFQRSSDPLKSSRLREYLYEGREGWYMPMVAEVVPGLLNISLFLFFAGLGDSLLNINTKVALGTIVPIGISGLLYIFTIFAPIIYPQSPYQNSLSSTFWYLFQKLRGWRFRDRESDGEMKPVSANMAQGQMQLAMEETEARKGRDVRAIQWLIANLTEDVEMEKVVSAIPGLFSTDWGMEVWMGVSKRHESEDQSQDEPVARPHSDTIARQPSSSWSMCSFLRPIIHLVRNIAPHYAHTHATTHPHSTTAHIQGENVVHELSTRVARSVEIYKNRGLFANDGLWRTRARSCIEATVSLVCCANANLAQFGDISKLLGEIGSFEKIQELSSAGTDELFVTRWTCLSLVVIRQILADNLNVPYHAGNAMVQFSRADDTGNSDGGATAQKIDEAIQKASGCLSQIYYALHKTEDLTEVKEILDGHKSQISDLEQINIEADRFAGVDDSISDMQNVINEYSHQIISQFPSQYHFDLHYEQPITFRLFAELSRSRKPRFMRPGLTLKSMCSPAVTLCNILEGQGDVDAYKELMKNLIDFPYLPGWLGDDMQRQLWCLESLRHGGGLGFTVETFFLAISQLLSTSPSKESHSTLYTSTFRAITSDWNKHKRSRGTQKLLLDIAIFHCNDFDGYYPAYIVDEFLLLLGNIFEGQTGTHIDEARQCFEPSITYGARRFRERVLMVLT
ncbi:hypothetical protein F5888DRAFT_1668231 [Russula emetica]|nr:hypothetical protein F5888DRAFT_1668231 [Russula emetica]